jgi:metallo-beta-lactamase family protein
MRLTFHGGAGEVTGANYLLESGTTKILIDCGMMQGSNYAERKNFEPFPYDPREISAVFVTHAHIDHTGRLPKLVGESFEGKVYSTAPTKEFSRHLLEDSIDILGREAKKCDALSFCNKENIKKLMEAWEGVDYHHEVTVGPFTVKFYNAGHILGSSSIEVKAEGKTIVFSGDLGNSPAPLIRPTEYFHEADYCLVESTYGGRFHKRVDKLRDDLEDIIEDTVKAGGTLMIPAFAMERTQTLLHHVDSLMGDGRIPKVPVFLDSPLAIRLTGVYKQFENYLNDEAKEFLKKDKTLFDFPSLKRTLRTEESKHILRISPPKVIIAGSGMSQGGRIIHHEKAYLPDPKSTILFVGFQVKGSLGRRILDGEKQVKILGEEVPVRARAVTIHGYSAHADQGQLLDWLSPMRQYLKKVFVVQGEESQSTALAQKIRDELAVSAHLPSPGEQIEL